MTIETVLRDAVTALSCNNVTASTAYAAAKLAAAIAAQAAAAEPDSAASHPWDFAALELDAAAHALRQDTEVVVHLDEAWYAEADLAQVAEQLRALVTVVLAWCVAALDTAGQPGVAATDYQIAAAHLRRGADEIP